MRNIELLELLGAVTAVQGSDDLAGGDFERGHQDCRRHPRTSRQTGFGISQATAGCTSARPWTFWPAGHPTCTSPAGLGEGDFVIERFFRRTGRSSSMPTPGW
uniref:hypothetical protein n=1 Tax=Streptomyces sp. CA-141956 TaxID=3240051 RepID=UPI003F49249C